MFDGGQDLCTLSNLPHCKRQLSRRHQLVDSGFDRMVNEENPVKRFAVLGFCRFQPNAALQSDVFGQCASPVSIHGPWAICRAILGERSIEDDE
jgi:hypothetical protein